MYEVKNPLGVRINKQYLWDNLPESCYVVQKPNVIKLSLRKGQNSYRK